MKFWTITIAVLALAVVASASGPAVSTTKTVTSSTIKSTTKLAPMSGNKDDHGKGNHGHGCVPEPISMLALIPGAAMFIRRRKQA